MCYQKRFLFHLYPVQHHIYDSFCSTEIFLTLAYQFFISVSCLLNGFSLFSVGSILFSFCNVLGKGEFLYYTIRDIIMINIISYLIK